MEQQVQNPFDGEKPKIVHLEKSDSHYEYCRMQMCEIDRVHRRTFLFNLVLCIVVSFLSVFKVYIGGFSLLSLPFANVDPATVNKAEMAGIMLAGGIFQVLMALIIVVLGYLAWANFRTLNIILEMWYVVVTLIGLFKASYLTAVIGIVGVMFYFFSIREMQHEEALSHMEGYPEFHEKFDIEKSDVVIQTLLAHQGEHRTKSTLFTTDYSLRKKKKKSFDVSAKDGAEGENASQALADELQKHLTEVQDARKARTAIASLEAVVAERERAKTEVQEAESAQAADAEPAETPAAETEPAAQESAPEAEAAELADQPEAPVTADDAESEASAQELPKKKPEAAKSAQESPKKKPEATKPAPAKQNQHGKQNRPAQKPQQQGSGNPQKKKKKKKH